MPSPAIAAQVPCPNHPEVTLGLTPCARCNKAFCGNCLVQLGGRSLCAVCKGEQVRDLRSGTDAPLDLASLGQRFGAQLVDSLLYLVPLALVLAASVGLSATSKNERAA